MSRLPNVRPKEVVAALKRIGFKEVKQKGSHLYLLSQDRKSMTSVPIHPGDLSRNTFKKILKQAKLSEDDFRDIL